MAFLRRILSGILDHKRLVAGFLGLNILAWIAYLVVQHFLEPSLRIKDYFSHDIRQATLNNGRTKQPYLTIHEPVVTPRGFNNSRFLLIIFVPSSPTNTENRNAIRKTWGRPENWNFFGRKPPVLRKYSYKTAFVIGTSSSLSTSRKISTEIIAENDILLGNFTDSYKSLYLKVFMALKWSLSTDWKYFLKVDDDVYVNVPLLSSWLSNKQSKLPKNLYSGNVIRRESPNRNKNSKFFVSRHLYSQDRFPSWCNGASYVLSRDLVSRILNASQVIRPLWIEDVYMGMLAYYLGVRPLEHDGFRLERFKDQQSSIECYFLNTFTYGHNLRLKEMIRIHDVFRRMNSRSNGALVFQCLSKDLAFMMGSVVPFLLLSITGIFICVAVLRWIRWRMVKRTTGK